jgi:O-antigen/teichoic acid export membrane protein
MFLSEFLGYIIVILDREHQAANALLVSTGVNVVLNLILIPRYGFLAAAVMTVVTEALLVAQYLWLLRREVRLLDWGFLARPMIAALVMGIVVYLLHGLLFVFDIAIGVALYVILLIVFRVIGRSEVDFVMALRKSDKRWVSE